MTMSETDGHRRDRSSRSGESLPSGGDDGKGHHHSSRSRSSSRGRAGGASKRATAAKLKHANTNDKGADDEKGYDGEGDTSTSRTTTTTRKANASSSDSSSSRGVSRNDSCARPRSSSHSRTVPRRARSLRALNAVNNHPGEAQSSSSGTEPETPDHSLSRSRHGTSTSRSSSKLSTTPSRRNLPPRSQSFVVARPGVGRSNNSSLTQTQSGRQAPRRTKSLCQGDLPGARGSKLDLLSGDAAAGPDPELVARRERMKEMYRQNPSNPLNDPKNGGKTDGGDGDVFGIDVFGSNDLVTGNTRSTQIQRGSSHRHTRVGNWGLDGSVGVASASLSSKSGHIGGSGGVKKDDLNDEQYLKMRQARQDSILEMARKEKWQAQERKMAELDHEESHFDADSGEDESDEEGLKVKKKKTAFGKVTKAVKKTAKKTAKTSKKIAGKGLDVALVVGSTTIDVSGKVANKTSHLIMNKKEHEGKEVYAHYNPAELASRQRSSSLLDRVISTDSVSSGHASGGSDNRSGHSHHSAEDTYLRRESAHSIALDSVDEEDLVGDELSSDEED